MAFLTKAIWNFGMLSIGRGSYFDAKTYVDEGNPINAGVMDSLLPFAKGAYLFLVIIRVPLMLVSLKKLSICKTYFYFQFVFSLVEVCLP